jgi:hypothetical protein
LVGESLMRAERPGEMLGELLFVEAGLVERVSGR